MRRGFSNIESLLSLLLRAFRSKFLFSTICSHLFSTITCRSLSYDNEAPLKTENIGSSFELNKGSQCSIPSTNTLSEIEL